MGDSNEMPQPRRRSGCLRWTCGCLIVFVMVIVGGGYLLFRHLTSWQPGDSPWDRLPGDTTWAVEVHDLETLVARAGTDPGFVSFLNHATAALNAFFLSEDVEGHPEDVLPQSFLMYQRFGVLHRLVVPNAFLIGGTGTGRNDMFAIVRPPAWLAYVLGLTGDGTVQRLDDDETDVFYARHDGWMILAFNGTAVQTVLNGWNAGAMPLGTGAGRRDAYIAVAATPKTASGTPGAPASGPGHFTLADPFANAAPAAASEPGVRLLVLPETSAWRVFGEAVPGGAWTAGSLSSLADAVPDPEPLRTNAYDLAVSARAAPEVAAKVRQEIQTRAAAAGGESGALLEWLHGGWLDGMGDEATFLAAPPVAADAPYPGLPVMALGWSVRDSVTVSDAAGRFASTLTAWTDGLRSASASALVQGAAAGIGVTAEAGGMRGRIAVPPVLVSGARPGWRFTETGGGMGWFATDAAALDTPPPETELPLAGLAPAEPGRASVAGAWALSPAIVDGTYAWLWDRFEMSRAYGRLSGDGQKVSRLVASLAAQLFHSYPRGQVRLRYGQPANRWGFAGRIPHGVAAPVR